MGTKAERSDIIKTAVLAILVGTAAFLILYGTTPLHIKNDNWIMAAIDEDDIVQHYAGWTMYRNAEWTFPIGMISDMARGTGTTISYTDSIPWVAVFFKILFGITRYSGDFQYFGFFALLCFILQAFAAGLLIQRKTQNLLFILFGMILFVSAPPLLDRSLRHTALGAQFLVLFAMLTYFKYRDAEYGRFPWGYVVLAVLAVGIHPYFLPMIMIFSFLSMAEGTAAGAASAKKGGYVSVKILEPVGQFVLSCLAAGFFGWILGAFASSGDVERDGYGYYSMNVLSLVNPVGGTGYNWSRSLPSFGQTNGNYEGFNFLGFGIILLGIVLLVLAVISASGRLGLFGKLAGRRHIGYFIAMLFMTAFAVTNVVTFGDKELFTVPLPGAIINICGIFRSSGRIFYPVFYSIYVFLVYRLWDFSAKNGLKTKKGIPCAWVLPVAAIAVVSALQIVDLSDVLIEKHGAMGRAAFYQSLLDDPSLQDMAEGCDFVVGTKKYRDVCVFAGLHNMGTSFSASTGGSWDEAYRIRDEYLDDLGRGVHDGHTMFVTESWTRATEWAKANPDLVMYQYGEDYFLAPEE